MFEQLTQWFDSTSFMPHGHCYLWRPHLLWLHVVSDAVTAFSYYSIPIALVYFIRKRSDIGFNWVFWMFALFIFACGTTHVMSIYTTWVPQYLSQGLVKALTAAASIITSYALWALMPTALKVPSPAQLKLANISLESEIAERRRAQEELLKIKASLEDRIAERTRELNDANRRLERILNLMPTGVLLIERDNGRVRFANRHADELFGGELPKANSVSEYHNHYNCTDTNGQRIPEIDLPAARVARGEKVQGMEMLCHLNKNTSRALLVSGEPLVDDDGVEREGVVTFMDVSNIKKIETELRNANRMKDEFLATVSHELRTPMNVIIGYLELLRDYKQSDEEYREAVTVMSRNANIQVSLIQDILDVSSIVSGRMRTNPVVVDFNAVVESSLASIRVSAATKDIKLKRNIAHSPTYVYVDPGRMQQVIWNLLTNAVKFTHPGGEIEVTVEQSESDIVLHVRDNGEGISNEFLPYVFQRFSQEDSSITRPHGGLGIGLSLAYHLVELHGGTIKVESKGKGMGSTFTVTLPKLTVAKRDELGEVVAEFPKHSDEKEALPPRKNKLRDVDVLVIDDQQDIRELLSISLRHAGAKVRLAESAAEGYRFYLESKPDIILCDIGMPGEDGLSLIKRLRKHEELTKTTTPAIALTAYAREEDKQRNIAAGFNMHIAKPVESHLLVAMIEKLIRRKATI